MGRGGERLPRNNPFLATIQFSNDKKIKEQRLLLNVFVPGFKLSDVAIEYKIIFQQKFLMGRNF